MISIVESAQAISSSSKIPGYCSPANTVNSICKNTNRELCKICREKHNDLLKKNFRELSLNNFLNFSVNECFQYFKKHKLWRKEGLNTYIPHKTNKLGKARKLQSLNIQQLTPGEIYQVFHKFLDMKKEKYKNDNDIHFDTEVESNLLLNFDFNHIRDFFDYNTKKQKRTFDIINRRPKNTTFNLYGFNIPVLSQLSLNITKGGNKPINSIPELTIKEKRFKKLSDQIKYYLDNFHELVGLQRDEAISNTPSNKSIITDYIDYVEQIEGVVKSNTSQANNYIKDTFSCIKNNWNKNIKNIYGDNFLDKVHFEIAPTKREERAIEKIIIAHNGDISKYTDNCRGTITFDTVNELQEGIFQLVKTLEQHNKYLHNKQKSSQNKIIEIYFEDKFGNFIDFSKKSSGYRDGKFLIKLGDGNVIELMVQLKDMSTAKNEGFHTVGGKDMKELIKELHFSKEEIAIINSIIKTLDSDGTKRNNFFPDGLPDFDKIQSGDKLPADFIYNIYRNLDEYNRDERKEEGDIFPFEKDIQKWNIVKKLQFLEREIYQRGFKLHSDRMFGISQTKDTETKNNNLKKRLLKE